MLISFICGLGLPLVSLVVAFAAAGTRGSWVQGGVATFAVQFLILWFIGFAVRQRAGAIGSFAAMTAKTAASGALLLAVLYGSLWVWDYWKGLDSDFAGIDILLPIGAAAVITFVVVSVLLSSIRKAASRIS